MTVLRHRASEPLLLQSGCNDRRMVSPQEVIDTIDHLQKLHFAEIKIWEGNIEKIRLALDAEKARVRELDTEIASSREQLQNEKRGDETLQIHMKKTLEAANRLEQEIDDIKHRLKKEEEKAARIMKLNAELREENIKTAKEKEELEERWTLKYKEVEETADYAQGVAGLALVQNAPAKSETSELGSVNRSLIALNCELTKRLKELESKHAHLREEHVCLGKDNSKLRVQVQEYTRFLEKILLDAGMEPETASSTEPEVGTHLSPG